ncbi:MAG: DUF1273 family protein [Oscillospiraceae bacterium]|nr:DUF1273 family protein [Oscillospiraceae bacterium]
MNAAEKQPFSVCFSGHRPEKLPDGSMLRMLLSLLFREIENAVRAGAETFYTGCAPGIDLWAADMVILLRNKYPSLRLICVLPYEKHGKRLRGDVRYHYQTVLRAADGIVTVVQDYSRSCYRMRNQYMIAHSQQLIAVVTDMRSGTGQTIRLAEAAGLTARIVSMEAAAAQRTYAHEYLKF